MIAEFVYRQLNRLGIGESMHTVDEALETSRNVGLNLEVWGQQARELSGTLDGSVREAGWLKYKGERRIEGVDVSSTQFLDYSPRTDGSVQAEFRYTKDVIIGDELFPSKGRQVSITLPDPEYRDLITIQACDPYGDGRVTYAYLHRDTASGELLRSLEVRTFRSINHRPIRIHVGPIRVDGDAVVPISTDPQNASDHVSLLVTADVLGELQDVYLNVRRLAEPLIGKMSRHR